MGQVREISHIGSYREAISESILHFFWFISYDGEGKLRLNTSGVRSNVNVILLSLLMEYLVKCV
jgi:hypothetical protein